MLNIEAHEISPIDEALVAACGGFVVILEIYPSLGLCLVDLGGLECWCGIPADWTMNHSVARLH